MTSKHDIWSLGILLYVILKGEFPFKGEENNALFNDIRNSEPKYSFANNDCNDLLKQMLNKDIKMRINSTQVLAHVWFKGETDPQADIATGSNKGNSAATLGNIKELGRRNKAVNIF